MAAYNEQQLHGTTQLRRSMRTKDRPLICNPDNLPNIEVYDTTDKGKGVRALQQILAGQDIVQYDGTLIS